MALHLPSVHELETIASKTGQVVVATGIVLAFIQEHANVIPGLDKYIPTVTEIEEILGFAASALAHVPPPA